MSVKPGTSRVDWGQALNIGIIVDCNGDCAQSASGMGNDPACLDGLGRILVLGLPEHFLSRLSPKDDRPSSGTISGLGLRLLQLEITASAIC
jgi:hypothetical protein